MPNNWYKHYCQKHPRKYVDKMASAQAGMHVYSNGTTTCPACGGSKRESLGRSCYTCGGLGRIPLLKEA